MSSQVEEQGSVGSQAQKVLQCIRHHKEEKDRRGEYAKRVRQTAAELNHATRWQRHQKDELRP